MRRPPLAYPECPLHELLLRHADREPSKIAIYFEDHGVRNVDLALGANSLAAALQDLGVAHGDRLALYLPNSVEYILALLAGSMVGAVVVPLNPSHRSREIRIPLDDAEVGTLIFGGTQWRAVAEIWPHLPSIRHVIAIGTPPSSQCLGFHDLLATYAGRSRSETRVDASKDLALLYYTSGTTGQPKGVMLSHRNFIATILQFAAAIGMQEDDLPVNFLPLSHVYGLMVTGASLAVGTPQILMDRFDLIRILTSVERYRGTMLFAVPPVLITLCQHEEVVRSHNLSSLRFINTGAAFQGTDIMRRVSRLTGIPVITGYGMTEAAPIAHTPLILSQVRLEAVGTVVSDTEVRIVDAETGARALSPGETGELVIRGPQVMQGYWRRPHETAEALRDGWLFTGDLASLDEDGYLTIVGRKKEIIKYKGFSIAPAEIASVLTEHPAVADCAVIGQPDAEAGEVPVAFVVIRPGAKIAPQELMDFVSTNLARYKRPHAVHFVPDIPRSASGKVLAEVLQTLEARNE